MTPVSAFAARHILAARPAVASNPPPPVPGYSAWFDASKITGQADNTPLATWPDSSPNGCTVTGSGTQRPTYYSTTPGKTVNGLPAVWFNGSTTVMIGGTATPLPQSLFVVGQPGSQSSIETFYNAYNGSAGLQVRIESGQVVLLAATVAKMITSTGLVPLVPSFMAVTYDQVTARVYINSGTADKSAANTTAAGAGPVMMGSTYPNPAQVLNGPLCEMLLYSTVLSAANITATYNYLKTKWGTP